MKNLYKIEDKLYVISDNKNINQNDYIITNDGRLVQVSYLLSKDLEGAYKVILTSNDLLIKDGVQAIDDEFLEWFVKNPSYEEVEIENLYDCDLYKIIIPKEEPKYPISGYAPGFYSCKCVTCGTVFMGDKRAVQCELCAIKITKGEWVVDLANSYLYETMIKNKDDVRIAQTKSFPSDLFNDATYEEQLANAKLIAASPLMYEYIKKKCESGCLEAKNILSKLNK